MLRICIFYRFYSLLKLIFLPYLSVLPVFVGDMFGPSMDNLEALLVIPWGTGEQNMVRFAPAVYAANYLNATRKQDDDLQKEIEEILITGTVD